MNAHKEQLVTQTPDEFLKRNINIRPSFILQGEILVPLPELGVMASISIAENQTVIIKFCCPQRGITNTKRLAIEPYLEGEEKYYRFQVDGTAFIWVNQVTSERKTVLKACEKITTDIVEFLNFWRALRK